MLFKKIIISIVVLFSLMANANAVNPDEILSNPALESRARNLSKEIRCMVCQNQSIDDSDASVAKDLRLLIRERIVAGDSDKQVVDYLVSRFGEFVLLKPRFTMANTLLWATPVLALIFGVFLLVGMIWRSKKQNSLKTELNEKSQIDAQLSKVEKSQITKILGESD